MSGNTKSPMKLDERIIDSFQTFGHGDYATAKLSKNGKYFLPVLAITCYCIVDDIFQINGTFLGGNKSSKLFVIDVVVPAGCG